MNWTDEKLEKFIRDNKDALIDGCRPTMYHEDNFLIKLSKRFKKFISIVPYLIKVMIITVLIFIVSTFVWYNYIYKAKDHPVIDKVIENIKK
jgi:hypothetical protein